MCVILVCETARPDESMVEKAWARNSHGGGVAWREGGVVRWKKGLSEGEMQDFCKTLPLPFIAHFRVMSVGVKHPTLCHPFPVTEDASTALQGKLKGGAVLFHNGTWGRWKETAMEVAIRKDTKVPIGLWNDSRAMAWVSALCGLGILEFIDEKAAVLTSTSLEIFGRGWSEKDNILMSNDLFLSGTTTVTHHYPAKTETTIVGPAQGVRSSGGSSDPSTFRRSGSAVPTGEAQQKEVQQGAQEVSKDVHKDKNGNIVVITPIKRHPVLRDPRFEVVTGDLGELPLLGATSRTASIQAELNERARRLEHHRKGIVYLGRM